MNALALLAENHQKLLELANALTGAAGDPSGTPRERRRTAQRLVALGSAHEAIEEQFFWPLVRDLDGGAPLALAGLDQEQTLKDHLQELQHMQAGNVHFGTAVFSIASHLRGHVTYEESQIWPKVQLAVSAATLDELGHEMEKAWPLSPTRPHPKTPPDPQLLKTLGPVIGAVDRVIDVVTLRGR